MSPLPLAPLTNPSPYSILIPLYAFSLFLPTIINDLGYKATEAQLLSTPPYVAGCICTIIVGIISDKYKSRGPFVCLSMTVAIIGYAILYGTNLKDPRGSQVCPLFFT
jgi:MFS family permease